MTRVLGIVGAFWRLGVAEAVAYRASMLVWILTTTFPLVSLALWGSLAADGPIGTWTYDDFVAYFVAAFLVRQLTASWVVWELEYLIREGDLTPLLMRPVHPLVHEAMLNLAAMPTRTLLSFPLGVVVLVWAGGLDWAGDWRMLTLAMLAVAAGWTINFLAQVTVGSMAFWLTRAAVLYEIWLGFYIVLSGYAVPTSLFPEWFAAIARVLPFHATLGFPVELAIGRLSPMEIWHGFALQLLWIAVLAVTAKLAWARGIRVYQAVGT